MRKHELQLIVCIRTYANPLIESTKIVDAQRRSPDGQVDLTVEREPQAQSMNSRL